MGYKEYVEPPPNVKTIKKKGKCFGAVITDVPLGILSMSSYLKSNHDVETKLVDFNIILNKIEEFKFESFADFFQDYLSSDEVKGFAPDIVGVSCLFTPSYMNMISIGDCVRDVFPDAVIVAGGGVPTNLSKEIFSDTKCFDALCFGEGEKPLLYLVRSQDMRACLSDHDGWMTKNSIDDKSRFKHDFIKNLDEIPTYDYELIDLAQYGLNPTIGAYTCINEYAGSIPVMTSRGCVYHCCFCSSHTVHGRGLRYHSLDRVESDFRKLKEKYDIKTIIFQDDHLMADPDRVHKIIGFMKELDLTGFFPNSLALYALDKKMLEALKSIGLTQLVLSVESGSERVLRDIMHKPLNLSIIKRVANDCKELGIYTDVNILIGLPGETKKDIEDAIEFLKTIDANWFRVNVATPLPGSEMFEICRDKGYFTGDYKECNYKKAVVETDDFSREYIQEMAYRMNLILNFVNNSDYRLGNYKTAIDGFNNAIRAKSDHAIAHYYRGMAQIKIGDDEEGQKNIKKGKEIARNDKFWGDYFRMFDIPLE